VSGRGLAIRPDLTAQVARVATTRMGHHPRPVRLCYAGAVLRLEAGALDPARERRQVGCELVGLDTVAAGREVVGVAADALAAAGATGASIDFTLPDLVDTAAAALPVSDLPALKAALDAKDAGAVAALAPAYLPLIAAAGPFDAALERLRAWEGAGALASRLDGLAMVADGVRGRARLTLDPTERHGFEYQSWLGFSLFAPGARGEAGRGGTYAITREDGTREAATGFSLYLDALPTAPAPDARRRLFLPLGTPAADGARLRGAGWVTVAALAEGDTPEAQLCTHVWNGDISPLAQA
jgi:ATP phosphoribosyltransferase regulatory subunit